MPSITATCTELWRHARATDPFEHSRLRQCPYWVIAAFIGLAHLLSSWFGYLLLSGGAQVTPVFPEAGLDLVIVLVFGTRYWPVLLAAYFASSVWRHVPWLPSCGVAAAGLIRTFAAAWLVRLVASFKKIIGHFEDLVAIAMAPAAAPALASSFGTVCLILGHRFPAAQWTTVLSRWWISDALGILTITPLLLAGARFRSLARGKHGRWFPLSATLYTACASAGCYFIFFRPGPSYLLFAVFALILIAAAALGPTAARLTALVIAAAAIWATHSGIGAFTGGSVREDLQNLDLFLAAVSLTGMALGAFRLIGNLMLPSVVLLAGWALSGWLYASMDQDRRNYNQARLDRVINSIERRMDGRYTAYEDALWSAAGHLAASERISPQDWRVYIRRSGLLERYPGTTQISIVQPVPRSEAPRFTEELRRRGWPDFAIRPMNPAAPAPDEFFPIVCAEPAAVARAIGADLATDERRRAAAEEARDTGHAILARNTQMRDGSGIGLQLFVPVYREGAPVGTAAARRQALLAWVSVVFSADTFFRAALADLQTNVALHAYDDSPGSLDSVLFASGPPRAGSRPFERTTDVTFGGRTWILGWDRLPDFPSVSKTPSTWAAGCTALLSLLLAGLVLVLQTTGRRTADRLKLIQSALALGTWEIRLDSAKVSCSGQLLRLYGIPPERDQIDLDEWLARVHPDERERRIAEAGANDEDREPIERQYRTVWPDGSVHWLHSKALVVFDHRGNATRMIGVDFDITQDKHNEERVRILSNAVEQSPVSICIMDLRNRIEYVNARLTQSTGYSFDELKGRDSRILIAPDTPQGVLDEIAECLKKGSSWKGILRTARKDGTTIAAASNILWIRDAAGTPTHRLSVALDITDRLEMEAALKLSEERFRVAAESSGDSIYEWDLRTDAVAVLGGNRIQPLASGWTLPKGKEFLAMLYPADRDAVEAAIRRHLDYGVPYSQEYRVMAPNGEIRHYSDTGSALRDEHGRPYKWIGVCKDITERKKVEHANAELAKIVECADAAMISEDLDGRIRTWNRGAERIYGYPAGEIAGRNINLLLPLDRGDEERSLMEKLRRGETIEHFETVRITKSGKPIDVLLTLSPIRDQAGKIIGGAHVAWDITQLKELQAQLAHAQKLESVGHLAAGVAHEINTPIQYIGDNGKFLEDAFRDLLAFAGARAKGRDEEVLDEALLEYLTQEIPAAIKQLLEGVHNVGRIVRAMKEFSHPGPIDKMPIDLNRAIESTIVVSRSEWKYVTDIQTDFDPDLPPVPCVAGEFNQVILNLIVNAAHAISDVVGDSGRKGAIRISTRQSGPMAEIRVSDTGCGIPESIRSKIFDPFFTTKPVGQGTGQGLALAHSIIVKKHGGSLTVESEPGQGSTFIIQLPLERALTPV